MGDVAARFYFVGPKEAAYGNMWGRMCADEYVALIGEILDANSKSNLVVELIVFLNQEAGPLFTPLCIKY